MDPGTSEGTNEAEPYMTSPSDAWIMSADGVVHHMLDWGCRYLVRSQDFHACRDQIWPEDDEANAASMAMKIYVISVLCTISVLSISILLLLLCGDKPRLLKRSIDD